MHAQLLFQLKNESHSRYNPTFSCNEKKANVTITDGVRASEGRTGNGANTRRRRKRRRMTGTYQEVGREFTSRIIKFYDEESVFPFVSWPPSLLHGLLDIRIRNRLIIILHLTVCTFACLQIYLQ